MNLDAQRLIRRDARRIAVTYLLVAAVWIWGSDYLLLRWFPDPSIEDILQTIKGFAFVSVTALLLYYSVRGQLLRHTTIEQVLQSTKSLGEAIFHASNDAILVLDERNEIRDANRQAEVLYGRLRASLTGTPLKSLLATSTNLQIADEQRTIQEKGSARWETRHLKADGTTFPAEVSAHVLDWDGHPHSVLVVRDITRRVENQKRIERLNRTYAVLSDVNQMIVRIREESRLFREACRIAVEKGRFRLAWIGELIPEDQSVRSIAASGPSVGYLDGISIKVDEGEHSRGPTATAFSRGSHVVSNDIENDPRMVPWRQRMLEFDLRASASFPIKRGGATVYVLNVYTGEAGHFDDQEVELLDEMASDISFALEFNDTLRRLQENEAITTAFMDNLPGVAFIKDADLRHRFVNREFERTLKLRATELMDKRIDELIPGHDTQVMVENDRVVLERTRPMLVEETIHLGDSPRTFLASKFPIRRPDGVVWLGGVAIDITERKHAAERLQYQAQLLSQMEQVAKIGAWEFDPESGKGSWTPGVARIHDLDPGYEATVQKGLSFYSGDDRERIEKAVRQAIEQAKPYDLELELTTAHGVRKWVHTMGYPLIRDGQVVKVYGSFQDITDRKHAEHSLQRNEQLLRLFVEHAPAGIAMFDRQMRYLLASRRYLSEYQIEGREVVGRSHYDVFPEIGDRWKEIHRRCLSGAVEREEEDQFPRADGTTDVVRWEIRPWYERSNEIGGIMLFSEVITDRKRMEFDLVASERRFRTLFENMTAGFVLFEAIVDGSKPVDLVILAANRGFESTTGLKASEVLGKRLTQALPGIERDQADWIGTYGTIAITGEAKEFEQHSELLGVHYAVAAFQAAPRQCAVTFFDITDRKRSELERVEMNRQLRALAQQLVTAREEERKTIAREIHDELGQELTAIRMDLSMAASAPTLKEVRSQLQGATVVADRAISTVRRLARELRPDVLDQLGLVEALKWLASEHEAHTRVPCRVRIVGDDPDLDDTSSTTLFRALQESLTNIVRHAQARSVDVVLQTRTNAVELEVLDDGRGPDLAKLSHPAGVGIIGMRERVEALGGSFEIGPRPEGGTRVSIRLPRSSPTKMETTS